MKDEIKQFISGILHVDADVLEDDLSVGDIPEWDSLRHMMIVKGLEREYSIAFSQEELVDVEDLSDLISLAEEKVNS